MLGGVVTGHIPATVGTRHYSAVLTPKGRMITDLFITRLPGDEERFFLDVSAAGREGLLAYFKRVLPPRFARVVDVTNEWAHLALVGPEATATAAKALAAMGFADTTPGILESLEDDDTRFAADTPNPAWIVRSPDTVPQRYDLFYPKDLDEEVGEALSGATAGSEEAWHALRIQAGTPEFGLDMTEKTIPIEAGIEQRAIDGGKGCYTGQEVIVRILHRGHVNRHLRTLRVSADTDAPGFGLADELFVQDSEKSVGRVTSVAPLPGAGAFVALAYVRREVSIGSTVRVGSPDGVAATVFERGPVE